MKRKPWDWPLLDEIADIGQEVRDARKGVKAYTAQLDEIDAAVRRILDRLNLPSKQTRWAINKEKDRFVEVGSDFKAPNGWEEVHWYPGLLQAFAPRDASGPWRFFRGTQMYRILRLTDNVRRNIASNNAQQTAELSQELERALVEFGWLPSELDERSGRKCRLAARGGGRKGELPADATEKYERWLSKWHDRVNKKHTKRHIAKEIAEGEGAPFNTVYSILLGRRRAS